MNEIYSNWNKWDLHVHTPESIVNEYKSNNNQDIWDRYIDELEKLDIKVLGINDYWFINGYKKILEYKKGGRLKNIELILPVIELRLKCLVGSNNTNKINYHIIFSNELDIKDIEEEFINKITIEGLEHRSLNIENLKAYGKKIQEDMPSDKETNIGFLEEGFNSFAIGIDKIKELLNKDIFKNKYLFAIGRSEWEDFRWDGSPDLKKTLINDAHFVFVASPTLETFNTSKEKLSTQKVNDLLIHCSDAHNFPKSNTTTSKDLGHCFTWIKAKYNFEGLKQVLFESKYRLRISQEHPTQPLYHIKYIDLDFPNNIKFKNDTFCFSNVKEKICLSPNLTCIIGGRGSGKSTLLNLIANKLDILEEKNFFELNISNQELLNYIKITPDSLNNVEYLAQNTIESFAIDTKSFSEAIFQRLNKTSKTELKETEDKIGKNLEIFDIHNKKLLNRLEKYKKLIKLKKEFKNFNNVVKALTDQEYIEKKEQLNKIQKEYSILEKSIKKLFSFLEIINIATTDEPYDILSSHICTGRDELGVYDLNIKDLHLIQEPQNQFDELYNEALLQIQKMYTNILDSNKYEQGYQRLRELKLKSKEIQNEIYQFLKDKGIKEESIQDIQIANEKIEKLKLEIKEIKNDIYKNKESLMKLDSTDIDKYIENYFDLINKQILKANDMLEKIASQNQDVKTIKIEFELQNNFFNDLFNEFELLLNISNEIRSYRETFKSYLKEIDFNDILNINYKKFISIIENKHKNTQTFTKINEIFSNKTNFLIYQTLIKKYKRNVALNKNFKVYYDSRNIKNSSFGQKCTSVIVIMLLLGNNPIIIDEPEAHLDSSLIANYLVNLIKEIKQDRQIIFATHNANFVLNADAELIIKLENNDGMTNFKYFSIEDIEYREDLLKLEGGKEAFKMRENKYGI